MNAPFHIDRPEVVDPASSTSTQASERGPGWLCITMLAIALLAFGNSAHATCDADGFISGANGPIVLGTAAALALAFVTPASAGAMGRWFPTNRLVRVKDAGHWRPAAAADDSRVL